MSDGTMQRTPRSEGGQDAPTSILHMLRGPSDERTVSHTDSAATMLLRMAARPETRAVPAARIGIASSLPVLVLRG